MKLTLDFVRYAMWNYAFIDWQNLHLWVIADWWDIDLSRFMIYLKNKYHITKAFYYIGFQDTKNNILYNDIQNAWFTLVFKQQTVQALSNKKWNVDSDMIFWVMKCLIKEPTQFENVLLVTWDWDFKILVDFLIQEWRFAKILLPNKRWSSNLLRKMPGVYRNFLLNIKHKIKK